MSTKLFSTTPLSQAGITILEEVLFQNKAKPVKAKIFNQGVFDQEEFDREFARAEAIRLGKPIPVDPISIVDQDQQYRVVPSGWPELSKINKGGNLIEGCRFLIQPTIGEGSCFFHSFAKSVNVIDRLRKSSDDQVRAPFFENRYDNSCFKFLEVDYTSAQHLDYVYKMGDLDRNRKEYIKDFRKSCIIWLLSPAFYSSEKDDQKLDQELTRKAYKKIYTTKEFMVRILEPIVLSQIPEFVNQSDQVNLAKNMELLDLRLMVNDEMFDKERYYSRLIGIMNQDYLNKQLPFSDDYKSLCQWESSIQLRNLSDKFYQSITIGHEQINQPELLSQLAVIFGSFDTMVILTKIVEARLRNQALSKTLVKVDQFELKELVKMIEAAVDSFKSFIKSCTIDLRSKFDLIQHPRVARKELLQIADNPIGNLPKYINAKSGKLFTDQDYIDLTSLDPRSHLDISGTVISSSVNKKGIPENKPDLKNPIYSNYYMMNNCSNLTNSDIQQEIALDLLYRELYDFNKDVGLQTIGLIGRIFNVNFKIFKVYDKITLLEFPGVESEYTDDKTVNIFVQHAGVNHFQSICKIFREDGRVVIQGFFDNDDIVMIALRDFYINSNASKYCDKTADAEKVYKTLVSKLELIKPLAPFKLKIDQN